MRMVVIVTLALTCWDENSCSVGSKLKSTSGNDFYYLTSRLCFPSKCHTLQCAVRGHRHSHLEKVDVSEQRLKGGGAGINLDPGSAQCASGGFGALMPTSQFLLMRTFAEARNSLAFKWGVWATVKAVLVQESVSGLSRAECWHPLPGDLHYGIFLSFCQQCCWSSWSCLDMDKAFLWWLSAHISCDFMTDLAF